MTWICKWIICLTSGMLQPSHCDPRPCGHSIWRGPSRCPDNKVFFTLQKGPKIIQSVFRRSDQLIEGYTMSREDGWFYFMVNGGGAVMLQFGKSSFPPRVETLFAPWNELILHLCFDPPIVFELHFPMKKFR